MLGLCKETVGLVAPAGRAFVLSPPSSLSALHPCSVFLMSAGYHPAPCLLPFRLVNAVSPSTGPDKWIRRAPSPSRRPHGVPVSPVLRMVYRSLRARNGIHVVRGRSGGPRTSNMMARRRQGPNNKRVAGTLFGTQGTYGEFCYSPGIPFTPRLLLAFLAYEGVSCLPRQSTIVFFSGRPVPLSPFRHKPRGRI